MAIPLPALQLSNPPAMPPPPAQPPTNEDVCNARRLVLEVEDRLTRVSKTTMPNDRSTPQDIARTHVYYHRVLSAAAGVAPDAPVTHDILVAEIQPVQEQLGNLRNEMRDGMNEIRNGMNEMRDGITRMRVDLEVILGNITRTSSQAYNRGCGDGTKTPYTSVLGRRQDGQMVLPETV